MCVAVPGLVLETDGGKGKVEISGNILDIRLGAVKAKPGDYVLVHAGCAVQTLSKTEAEEICDLLKELAEIWYD